MKKLLIVAILLGSGAAAYAVGCCHLGAKCCPGPCCAAKAK